ncbi:MAG: thioredoxin family protein [Akkermansia muciniphila]|nr:thioredoxin family protein [Akkermansia muciniphila]
MYHASAFFLIPAALIAPAIGAEWMTDFDAAKARAAKEGKAVLIDFTGSDWCGYCIKLRRDVFDKDDFTVYAKDKFVLLEIDQPHKIKMPPEKLAANRKLAESYGVDGYPTVLVVDSEGILMGGFCGYPGSADEVQDLLDNAYDNYKKLKDAGKDKKLEVLRTIYDGLDEDLQECADSLRRAIIAADPEDKAGLRKAMAAKEERRGILDDLHEAPTPQRCLEIIDAHLPGISAENRTGLLAMKELILLNTARSVDDVIKARDTIAAALETEKDPKIIAAIRKNIEERYKDPAETLRLIRDDEEEEEETEADEAQPASSDQQEVPEQKLSWETDFEAAAQRAEREGKLLLVEFTGSDWCGACMQMHRSVLDKPEFADEIRPGFIPVCLDYPRKTEQAAELKKQNNELARRYAIQGFPTLLVLTPSGELCGGFAGCRTRVQDVLDILDAARHSADKLKKSASLPPQERLAILVELYRALPEALRPTAAALRSEIAALDPQDTAGIAREESVLAEQERINTRMAGIRSPEERLLVLEELLRSAHKENLAMLYDLQENALLATATSTEHVARAEQAALLAAESLRILNPTRAERAKKEALARYADKAATLRELNELRAKHRPDR